MGDVKGSDPRAVRTWDEVAAEYSRRNPGDAIGRAMVWKVGKQALRKMKARLTAAANGGRGTETKE